jgi:hypothetical protein
MCATSASSACRHRPAAPARERPPPPPRSPQLRRHDVELFGADLADRGQRPAAARAIAVLDVDHHLVARQVRRQGAVIASRRLGARLARQAGRRCRLFLCGLVGGDGLLGRPLMRLPMTEERRAAQERTMVRRIMQGALVLSAVAAGIDQVSVITACLGWS